MGGVAFSDVILLKSLLMKHEAQNVTATFTKKYGGNTVDLHVWTKVPASRKAGNEQILYGRLRASSSLASYR